MRKCILVLLILSGVAAARDPVDAERAALRKKLTRLAKARKSLAASQPQLAIDNSASKELLRMAEGSKVPTEPVAYRQTGPQIAAVGESPTSVPQATVSGPANAPPAGGVGTVVAPGHEVMNSPTTGDLQGANGTQEVSLGEIARRYRAQKRQQLSSGH